MDEGRCAIRSVLLKEMHIEVDSRFRSAYKRYQVRYNLRRRMEVFHLGDLVWRKNYVLSDAAKGFSAKLAPKFSGPFKIIEKLSDRVFKLDDGSKITWHVKDLKRDPG